MDNNAKIEKIPEEEIKKAIESFDPFKTYLKDTYIDMYDVNAWRVGVIEKITEDRIEVHFEGWGRKFDEKNVKVTEVRVAPFRKHTRGYTGQQKSTFREFTYSRDTKLALEAKLKGLMERSFVVEDPYEFNQFFRGELFFFVDSLLTSLGVSPPAHEFGSEILKFLELYLQMIVQWLKLLWDLKEELETAGKWDLLYAVHGRTSVALSYPDIAESLSKLFGGSIRSPRSFIILYNICQGLPSDNIIDSNKAVEWVVGHFYKKFRELGGLDEILNLVKG